MNRKWEVRIADGVIQDFLSRPVHPLVAAVLGEWLVALRRRLQETDGYPEDVFLVHTLTPNLLGILFEKRLIALFTHRRFRVRSWKSLWLRSWETREVVITWLFVLPD